MRGNTSGARESLEGLERFQWGIKQPQEVHKFSYVRVRLTADASGDFAGCLLELRPDSETPGGIRAVPMDQIGFAKRDGSGFVYFSLADFERGLWKEDSAIDPHRGVKVIGTGEARIREVLEEHGIQFTNWRPMDHPPEDEPVTIDQVVRFTQEHLRAIAKIAFNYLAFTHGPAFVLRNEFDSTRRFIRYGVQPFLPAVRLSEQEIFRPIPTADENQRAVAHILTIVKPSNAAVTLGQVTLFNWMRYDVVLAYSLVPGLVETGHLFEPRSLTVHQLGKKTVTS